MDRRVSLFCEDIAHENFGRALISRCAREERVSIAVSVPTARFGIPRLKTELNAFQAVLRRTAGVPDVLAVLVDANDAGVATRRSEVESLLDGSLFPASLVGIPDPYIERWMLADPVSFAELFGSQPEIGSIRTRGEWKQRLVDALDAAGEVVTQGGAEFAEEVVEAMDLARASTNAPSLGTFVSDLRSALRQLKLAPGN